MPAHLAVYNETVSEAVVQEVARRALEGSRQHAVITEPRIPHHHSAAVRALFTVLLCVQELMVSIVRRGEDWVLFRAVVG